MLDLESGDRIEVCYEDSPMTTIRATVDRLLTDREEALGIEAEDYIASWIEITVDESNGGEANQVVLLSNDFQYWLNGRRVTLRMRND